MVGRARRSIQGVALAALLGACATGCRPEASCPPPSDEQLESFVRLQREGLDLYQKQETDSAIARLEQARALNPCEASIYNDLGIAYQQKHDTEKARAALRRGIELDPLYALSHLNLAIVSDESGDAALAVTEFRAFLELNPDFPDAQKRLALSLLKLGRYPEAKAAFERLRTLDPGEPEAPLRLGEIAERDQRLDDAVAAYRQVLDLNPAAAGAVYKLANLLQRLGREDQARPWFARFQELTEQQKRVTELEQALDSAPDHRTEILPRLAREYAAIGRFEDAAHTYERALALRPGDASLVVGMADAYRRLRRFDQATAILLKAKETLPRSLPVSDLLMATYTDQGKLDLAIAEVREQMSLYPEHLDARLNLGILEHRRGDYKQARETLTAYLAQRPDSLLGHEVLLSIHTGAVDVRLSDPRAAAVEARAAERLGSRRYDLLARAYRLQGDRARARSLLERGIAAEQGEALARLKRDLDQLESEEPGR